MRKVRMLTLTIYANFFLKKIRHRQVGRNLGYGWRTPAAFQNVGQSSDIDIWHYKTWQMSDKIDIHDNCLFCADNSAPPYDRATLKTFSWSTSCSEYHDTSLVRRLHLDEEV